MKRDIDPGVRMAAYILLSAMFSLAMLGGCAAWWLLR